jgi:predicted ferric reductase
MTDIGHTYWFLSRAAGLVAYLLLFASVVLGLTMTGGVLERVLRRYRVYDLHRFLAILALAVSVFHALIVLPDRYVRFSILDLLAPVASPYEPAFLTIGALALYLTAIVVATFYLRRFVPYRAWRLLHYATFAAFALALIHSAGAGTDSSAAWVQYLYAVTGLIAFNLAVYRLLNGSARPGATAQAPALQQRSPHQANVDGEVSAHL